MKNKQILISKYKELEGLSDEELAMKCVTGHKENGITGYNFCCRRSFYLSKESALEECKLWLTQETLGTTT